MRFPSRALRLGRENAESLMVDTVKVERKTGVKVVDETTFKPTDEIVDVYSGRAKIQAFEGQYEQSREAGGGNYVLSRSYIHFPVSAGPFQQGDRVTVQTSPFDGDRVGEVYQLEASTGKSLATAQRLPVTLVEAVR